MNLRQSVFIAASLDGFIARANGEIDWLEFDYGESDGGDYGYRAFFNSVDALVMGRNSFEKVLTLGGEWYYEDKPVIVLSSGKVYIPEKLSATVSTMSGQPEKVTEQLATRGFKHLYIDGGQTIQRFLSSGFIQTITITTIPILLGDGIPLFGPLKNDIRLRHLSAKAFSNGFVQNTYEVNRS